MNTWTGKVVECSKIYHTVVYSENFNKRRNKWYILAWYLLKLAPFGTLNGIFITNIWYIWALVGKTSFIWTLYCLSCRICASSYSKGLLTGILVPGNASECYFLPSSVYHWYCRVGSPLSQVVNGSDLFHHLPTDHTTGGSPHPPPFPLPSPPTRHYSTVACLLDDSILFTPFSAWALNFMKMT